ncbi:E3 ubiquitin-protein ligase rnf8-B isoform X3 [Brassica napus]|nr:E3 ubiquitin-protein ligase rnf8-B isoform X3 [Brassica napus]
MGFIGMENVVATVSGYHGSERFKLIKLISLSGASYVGAMSRSITHLVCWKFEGKKYHLANKFNTIVVNHQWVEACIREGRRVSEAPYTFESGEEVGPLMVELPADSGEAKVTKKANNPADTFDKYFSNGEESRRSRRTSELSTWMDSVLLKEKNTESTRHSVRLRTKRPSNIFEDKEYTCVAESSRKGKRRQQRKSQDPRELNDENVEDCVLEQGETSAREHPRDSTTQDWAADEIEESENWNHSAVFKRPRSINAEKSNFNKPDSREEETEATKMVSAQVSCVICWTGFSSTRGILPCGHRFCYSCIQQWVDRLVSERKKTTCPLCKFSFVTITKIEDAGSSDQKIYSQTVPDPSSTNNSLVVLPEEGEERQGFNPLTRASACGRCSLSEPVDLLIRCHICNFRRIHTYCLDPYLVPWTCNHCNDLQMLYHRRGY